MRALGARKVVDLVHASAVRVAQRRRGGAERQGIFAPALPGSTRARRFSSIRSQVLCALRVDVSP